MAIPFCFIRAPIVSVVFSKNTLLSSLCKRANNDNFPACSSENPNISFNSVKTSKVSPPKSATNPVWAVKILNDLLKRLLILLMIYKLYKNQQ